VPKKQTQQSGYLAILIGPAVILSFYAMFRTAYPSQTAGIVTRLEQDVQKLQEQQPPMEQRLVLTEQLSQKQKEISEAQDRLDKLRRDVGQTMRAKFDNHQQLQLSSQLNQILEDAGLSLVNESSVNSSNQPDLLHSLANATEELGDTLTGLASKDQENAPIQLPPDLPRDVNPAQWIAQQRALRVGQFDGPETHLNRLRLVGDYQSMLRGLEAISDTCPDVVVVSVSFQQPAVRTGHTIPLVWDMQLQMRPSQPSPAPSPSPGPLVSHPQQEPATSEVLHTVSKPIIESPEPVPAMTSQEPGAADASF